MEQQGNIKNLIAEGRLSEAFASFESFVHKCEEARNELLQSQNRYFSLQERINADIVGNEATIELNRITFSFLNQLEKFHSDVLAFHFDVADKEEYFKKITSRDQLINEILELRLRSKFYKLDGELANGNSSEVYRLLNPYTGRHAIGMVLKLPSLIPEVKSQVMQLTNLRHRNVIKLIDYELDAYPFFVIMDFVYGPTLHEAIAKTGPRSAAQAVDWLFQLTNAMDYLRQKRLLHTNLRPSKIFIDDEWQVMISPLDLNKTSMGGYSLKRYLDVCRYGSPEFLQSEGQDINLESMGFSDQYSLGLIAYKILTGEDLFHGDSVYEVLENRRKFARDNAYRAKKLEIIPAEIFRQPGGETYTLPEIIHRLLKEKPSDRFGSLHELLRIIHPFVWADNPNISLSWQSYRRCIALNNEFIRDFYQAFHQSAPETEKEFDLVSRHRQSAMLQMAIDILLDIDDKQDLLLNLVNNAKHTKFEPAYFATFLDALLETLQKNDPQWNAEIAEEWGSIRDKTIGVIAGRGN